LLVLEEMANQKDLLDKMSKEIDRAEEAYGIAQVGLSDFDAKDKVEKKKEMERHVDETINNVAHGTNINSGST
ncbi:unnamed protein product, partial [Didymodactylos carnosus]